MKLPKPLRGLPSDLASNKHKYLDGGDDEHLHVFDAGQLVEAGHGPTCRECGFEAPPLPVEHEHQWVDAPDWEMGPGRKAQECFPCRGLRVVPS